MAWSGIQVRKQNDMICYVIEDNANGYIESHHGRMQ